MRRYSHATFWNGKKKNMTEEACLWEVILWMWRLHEKSGALAADESM